MLSNGRPRDVQKERYWQQVVREQADSGLPAGAWCLAHGVEPKAFYRWRVKLARRDSERPSFVPVHVSEDHLGPPKSWIEIVLASGVCVRVHGRVNRQAIADVLAVVEGQAC